MLKELWDRIRGRRGAAAGERAEEHERMSPAEQRFTSESVEDRAARLESEAHLDEYGPEPAGD